MTFVAPALLSSTELLDAGFVLAKRHFLVILGATLPLLVPAAVVDIGLDLATGGSGWAIWVSTAVWALVEAMALAACWDLVNGRAANATQSWRQVAQRPGAIVFGYAFKWLAIIVGLVLLIAPGVYFIARYFAVPAVSVTERLSLREAFRRSAHLATREAGRILATVGLVEGGGMVLGIGLMFAFQQPTAEEPAILQLAMGWVLAVALLPLRTAVTTLVYLDIRRRREGYDLQTALVEL